MFFNDNCDVWWPIWISRPPTAQRTALQDKALHAKAFETCWAQLSPVLCWTLSGLGFLWDPQSSPCWFTKSWASNNDNDIFFFGQLVNSHIIIWSIIIYNLLTNGHVHKKGPFVIDMSFPQDKSQGLTSTETAFSASASSLPVSCRDGPGERQMFRCFSMVSTEVFHGKNWKNMGNFTGKASGKTMGNSSCHPRTRRGKIIGLGSGHVGWVCVDHGDVLHFEHGFWMVFRHQFIGHRDDSPFCFGATVWSL